MPLPKCLKDSLELPVIGSPLFIVSGPELVIAQCKAGIVGSFPALNARPAHVLEEWITRIKGELGEYQAKHPEKKVAPFAVNQICHASNDRLAHDIEVCTKLEVPIIITSLRPPQEVVSAAHSYGGVVFHDVINVKHAKKAAEQGVDGLILVCAGAGGHAGTLSPFALVREVKQWFDGTVILSGALSDGYGIASTLALGADLAYMGTRFVATAEANAEQGYKQHLIDYAADDIVYTNLFTGVHGNYLAPSVAAAGLDPANLPAADKSKMNFGSGGNMKQKAWKDIWGSGQGIGQIKDAPPVAELVDRLKREYVQACSEFAAKMPREALTALKAAAAE
jgi:nitronate monooxygenase